MNEIALYVIAAVTAFIFSGLNPAIILSRLVYHSDIREEGSKNPGFTNFRRVYGNKYAWFVFALDILKSVVFCAFFGMLFGRLYGHYQLGVAFTGFFAMLGHCFPIWYHLKGGKGFLVYVGMIWMVDWRVGLAVTAIFLVILFTVKYMSLASICLAVFSPVLLAFTAYDSPAVLYLCILSSVLMIARHHANIRRLINHTESRFTVHSKKTDVQ
ncbi:MAG: glycerol-3-phosphate acyltransferase [Lachnospiraceae bacterium]|nr:glycerol-3-phosphate acyltransferase [Lachnospiraceae bacterium]